MTKFLNISTDNTLGGSSASDVVVASQKAVKDYVDTHGGGGGSVAIDGTTITRNTNNEIQTVAVINGNTASGATNPVYDWVGTIEEYTSQAVATTHPDWLCFITNKNHSNVSHYVVAAQHPNAGNGYTWYFKYSDNWVEMGGIATLPQQSASTLATATASFPIAMADGQYSVGWAQLSDAGNSHELTQVSVNRNTTSIGINFYSIAATTGGNVISWQIEGVGA